MGFLAPWWLALAIPAVFLIWRFRHHRLSSNVLRTIAALALIGALAEPYWRTFAPGRHVIVLVDRSLSMPADHEDRALEAIRLLEAERGPGDALGVLSFGARPRLDRQPSDTLRFGGFEAEVDGQASDLAGAIQAGLEWIPEGRRGSLLVLSDGEATGEDPLAYAHRAAARGVRIDAIPRATQLTSDTSVERFALPPEAHVGEPFQFEAWISAARPEERRVFLRRDGVVVADRIEALQPGANRLLFRDVIMTGGVSTYLLEVTPLTGALPDARPENDRGLGAVRITAPPRVLLLNEDGSTDSLARALELAGIPVDVRAPEDTLLTRLALTRYRAVILENVAASRIGFDGMHALRDFVVSRGGGLWMTGGRASFGIGGYHLSPLDEVLPVASDMRSDTRKIGLALGLVLDRSGSMSVDATPGVTKMSLANNGTIAAIELLGALDVVTVFATDTAPHEVVPLQPADKLPDFRADILGIESMGGGIYTLNGLEAVAQVIERAGQANRHLILFADAADAEQQGGVQALTEDLNAAGITISVIALGTEADPDAAFLKDVAAWGGGEVYFTTEARDLPRLFAQDTMTMARATFESEPHAVRAESGLFAMGEFGLATEGGLVAFPDVGGYNLVHRRPNTSIGASVIDDAATPLLASAQRGAGRAVSYAGQVGGTFGADLVAWPEFANFVNSTARFLLGDAPPTAFFGTTYVEGQDAVVRVEVDLGEDPDLSKLEAHITTGDGAAHVLPLRSLDERNFEARLELDEPGVALATLHLAGGASLDLPPLALPYSPEFERRDDPRAGERLLTLLTRATNGTLVTNLASAFDGPREGERWRIMSPAFLLLGLLALLVEIVVRRLGLFQAQALELREPAVPHVEPHRITKRSQPVAPTEAVKPTTPKPSLSNEGAASMQEALRRARERAGKRLDR